MEERLQAKVVEAEEFVLRNSEGTVRARMTSQLSSAAIQLLDHNGTMRLVLEVRDEPSHQAHVELLGSNGETRARMWADDGAAQVSLGDKGGDSAILMSMIDTKDLRLGPQLWVKGRGGAIEMGIDQNQLPHFYLTDLAGYTRIHLTVDGRGQPYVFRHRAWAPSFSATVGKEQWLYDVFPVGWLIFNKLSPATYLHQKLKKFEARLTSALVELGDTPQKIETTLTTLGIMPPKDEVCVGGTLIARYLCRRQGTRRTRLADDCIIQNFRAVCQRRFWLFWWLQAYVEMPPAVCDFNQRYYNDGKFAGKWPQRN